jgi:methylthioribose-1-phosphate isomerase
LTAWELTRLGVPFDLVVDGAAPSVVARGLVDAILVGADRIAANGDTANKVGTFSLSLAARYAAIPFVVVAPESTIDTATTTGADIEIEDRGAEEVRSVRGIPVAPEGVSALNPAFDVTPAALSPRSSPIAGSSTSRPGSVRMTEPPSLPRSWSAAVAGMARVGRYAVDHGLVVASGGNLSVRGDGTDHPRDRFLVTGRGTFLDALDASSFAELDLGGAVHAGAEPSSEWRLHQRTYLRRPDVGAIVHLHPAYSVLLDALGAPLRLLTLDHVAYVGEPTRIPFLPNGSDELADAAAPGRGEQRLRRAGPPRLFGARADPGGGLPGRGQPGERGRGDLSPAAARRRDDRVPAPAARHRQPRPDRSVTPPRAAGGATATGR